MPQKILTQKDDKRGSLLRARSFGTKTRAIILLDLSDTLIEEFLIEAGKSLDIGFIRIQDCSPEDISGFDAFVTDCTTEKLDIVDLIKNSLVPILPKENPYASTLEEFDPMKFSGNAFLFDTLDRYKILEKIIRYLENIRYSGDKRTLLSNIAKTF